MESQLESVTAQPLENSFGRVAMMGRDSEMVAMAGRDWNSGPLGKRL